MFPGLGFKPAAGSADAHAESYVATVPESELVGISLVPESDVSSTPASVPSFQLPARPTHAPGPPVQHQWPEVSCSASVQLQY